MTEHAFREALAQGTGRPFLALQSQSSEPYREIILDACLRNRVYDPSCESERAPYLYELIQLTGEPAFYRGALLAALRTATDSQSNDQQQQLQLACEFARHGDAEARRVTYDADFSIRAMFSH